MKKAILFFLLMLGVISVHAQALKVAVAANAQFVIEKLRADFKKKTGIDIEVILGSSGKLSAQIKNGAPFDLFLSADMEFPNSLYEDGLTLQKPKVYASGSLIICSNTKYDLKNWKSLISDVRIKKIAIANPALAPYGKAAQETLQRSDLWKAAESKLVFGESISQVNTYLTTGAADLAFTTKALLYEGTGETGLNWFEIDDALYSRIDQGMVVLNYAKKGNLDKAMKFYQYLSSAPAKQLLRKNGYKVP